MFWKQGTMLDKAAALLILMLGFALVSFVINLVIRWGHKKYGDDDISEDAQRLGKLIRSLFVRRK